jgi:hypothetical protein
MSLSPKVSEFNPAEWYSLARWLFDTKPDASSQCLRRTIIGRAYYAALLCARDTTNSSTFEKGGHVNVINALKAKYSIAAKKLDALRRKRQVADYMMEEDISSRDVEICLNDSRIVLFELGKLPSDVPPHNKPYLDNYLNGNKFIVKP